MFTIYSNILTKSCLNTSMIRLATHSCYVEQVNEMYYDGCVCHLLVSRSQHSARHITDFIILPNARSTIYFQHT